MTEQPLLTATRREALPPLATALLAAIAPLVPGEVGTVSASKKTKGIKLKKCKKQAGKCRSIFEAECGGEVLCDRLLACCDQFSQCNADAGLRCIFAPPVNARQPRGMPRGLPPR